MGGRVIVIETLEDILDADRARAQSGKPPLLTGEGYDFFCRLVKEMKSSRLTQITKDILKQGK